jgi:hypothetical protein
VQQASLTLIGKEDTRFIELARAGLVKDDRSQIEFELNPDWVVPLLPILDELPREQLYTELQVNPTTFRRWISGAAPPSDSFRQQLERFCFEHVTTHLKLLGLQVPDHPANAFELYASIIPALKTSIAATLKALTEKGQASEVARRLLLNRRTILRWITSPNAIPASRTLGDLAYSYPEAIAGIAASFADGPSASNLERTLQPKEPPASEQIPAPIPLGCFGAAILGCCPAERLDKEASGVAVGSENSVRNAATQVCPRAGIGLDSIQRNPPTIAPSPPSQNPPVPKC